eukprot:7872621-Alexandrium_andersonii.AAC.1
MALPESLAARTHRCLRMIKATTRSHTRQHGKSPSGAGAKLAWVSCQCAMTSDTGACSADVL